MKPRDSFQVFIQAQRARVTLLLSTLGRPVQRRRKPARADQQDPIVSKCYRRVETIEPEQDR